MDRFPHGGFPGGSGPGRFAGRFMVEHHGPTWLAVLHTIMPFLVVLAVGALLAWVVLRVATDRGRPLMQPAAGTSQAPPRVDSALAELRMRYARGEIDRDEFVGRSADLGEAFPPAPPPAAPETPPEA